MFLKLAEFLIRTILFRWFHCQYPCVGADNVIKIMRNEHSSFLSVRPCVRPGRKSLSPISIFLEFKWPFLEIIYTRLQYDPSQRTLRNEWRFDETFISTIKLSQFLLILSLLKILVWIILDSNFMWISYHPVLHERSWLKVFFQFVWIFCWILNVLFIC